MAIPSPHGSHRDPDAAELRRAVVDDRATAAQLGAAADSGARGSRAAAESPPAVEPRARARGPVSCRPSTRAPRCRAARMPSACAGDPLAHWRVVTGRWMPSRSSRRRTCCVRIGPASIARRAGVKLVERLDPARLRCRGVAAEDCRAQPAIPEVRCQERWYPVVHLAGCVACLTDYDDEHSPPLHCTSRTEHQR